MAGLREYLADYQARIAAQSQTRASPGYDPAQSGNLGAVSAQPSNLDSGPWPAGSSGTARPTGPVNLNARAAPRGAASPAPVTPPTGGAALAPMQPPRRSLSVDDEEGGSSGIGEAVGNLAGAVMNSKRAQQSGGPPKDMAPNLKDNKNGVTFMQAAKKAPADVRKQYIDQLEKQVGDIDSTYDSMVKQMGQRPDRNLSRQDKGFLIMQFGLSLMRNSESQGLGGAIGSAGTETLAGYAGMKQNLLGQQRQYDANMIQIEKARADDKRQALKDYGDALSAGELADYRNRSAAAREREVDSTANLNTERAKTERVRAANENARIGIESRREKRLAEKDLRDADKDTVRAERLARAYVKDGMDPKKAEARAMREVYGRGGGGRDESNLRARAIEYAEKTVKKPMLGATPEEQTAYESNLSKARDEYMGYVRDAAEEQGVPDAELAPGTEQDGYRYLGGDPSDPSSWEEL